MSSGLCSGHRSYAPSHREHVLNMGRAGGGGGGGGEGGGGETASSKQQTLAAKGGQ